MVRAGAWQVPDFEQILAGLRNEIREFRAVVFPPASRLQALVDRFTCGVIERSELPAQRFGERKSRSTTETDDHSNIPGEHEQNRKCRRPHGLRLREFVSVVDECDGVCTGRLRHSSCASTHAGWWSQPPPPATAGLRVREKRATRLIIPSPDAARLAPACCGRRDGDGGDVARAPPQPSSASAAASSAAEVYGEKHGGGIERRANERSSR